MGTVGNKSRTGMTNSPEMRKHISEALMGTRCGLGNKSRTGQKRSPEEIAKGIATRIANGNHIRTAETRAKMSAAKKGKPNPHGSTGLGRKHSEETKKRWSEMRKGYQWSDIAKQRLSDAKKGIPRSEECKQKLRDAWVGRHDECVARGKMAWAKGKKTDEMLSNSLKSRGIKPNKIETTILEILDEHYPSEWSYKLD
jgi:polyhydroxyalkanoate synthesis regulator phasin